MKQVRIAAVAVLVIVFAGCSSAHQEALTPSPRTPDSTSVPSTSTLAPATTTPMPASTLTSTSTTTSTTVVVTTPVLGGPAPAVAASADGGPGTFSPAATGPLSGKVVAIDPGHNGDSYTDPSYINSIIFNGREDETCDTTGTETDSGYTEAQFNFNVAEYLTADLRAEGATVVLTRTTNTGIGPCVTERAAIGNKAHADAALSIHADGGPADGQGFAILEPVADGINDAIVAPSATLGEDLRDAFAAGTGEIYSTYDGVDGIEPRDDLGGINLSTVPKVFIECANMRNATDAAKVVSPEWQALAAKAIAAGLTTFLTAR
jgi:N-acetylmuramoyl-L-alanine amidase